ncbi:hypothetical protein GGR50DRAFT_125693 [Xylaria sp. CBS 124048]|nr:hypothetical protein GGR50DRAFT_125693 [Xylaria sp. CBS 124048]
MEHVLHVLFCFFFLFFFQKNKTTWVLWLRSMPFSLIILFNERMCGENDRLLCTTPNLATRLSIWVSDSGSCVVFWARHEPPYLNHRPQGEMAEWLWRRVQVSSDFRYVEQISRWSNPRGFESHSHHFYLFARELYRLNAYPV